MEDEVLKKSRLDATGNLSSMPIHMADLGSDNFEQEFAIELVDSERKMLREIDDALARIEEGTYGICQGLNTPIPKARLEAQPWARYSVEYAQMLEKGEVAGRKGINFSGPNRPLTLLRAVSLSNGKNLKSTNNIGNPRNGQNLYLKCTDK